MPLAVAVLGFGGEEEHRVPAEDDGRTVVFVAAGVGITPALAQVPGLVAAGRGVRVLWALRGEDVGFVEDVFGRVAGLAERTVVFVTGVEEEEGGVDRLRGLGSEVVEGRSMGREYVMQAGVGRRGNMCVRGVRS